MEYPIIDIIVSAYLNNGWSGLDIPDSVQINAKQEGSGTPSPTNVRPILPGAIFNINNEDVPVYGGILDTHTGTVTINKSFLTISSGANFGKTASSASTTVFRKSSVISSGITTESGQLSNLFQLNPYAHSAHTERANTFVLGSSGNLFIQTDSTVTDVTGLNSLLTAHPMQIVYPITTPSTISIDRSDIHNYIDPEVLENVHMKFPLPIMKCYPVLSALQKAAAGTQTADDTEILRHYLTPLGIGGI